MNRDDEPLRTYAGDGFAIEWRDDRCIHSGNCARGLRAVFDPRRRPWIDPAAATAEEIEATVKTCPSGALKFVKKA